MIRGSILERRAILHARTGESDVIGLTPVPGWLYSIKTDSVLFGSLPDSVIGLFTLSTPNNVDGDSSPGRTVLVQAIRPSSDPETYWGTILPVHPEGRVGLGPGFSDLSQSEPVLLRDLLPALRERRHRHPIVALEGVGAICLIRVAALAPRPEGGYAAFVDSLDWLMGPTRPSPRRIAFPALPHCRGISVGDTLLIPVPIAPTGPDLDATFCPSGLRVTHDRIPGLACRLHDLGDVLGNVGGRIHVVAVRRNR